MHGDFTKSDRKRIRELADLAWDRRLRLELRKIAVAMEEMENGRLTPIDVTDRIHIFHDGAVRDLCNQVSTSLPWTAVCRAYFDGVLTNEDIIDASSNVRDGILRFAASFAKLARERETTESARSRRRCSPTPHASGVVVMWHKRGRRCDRDRLCRAALL
ncbi:MAG TPA: hypothetical protein P5307_18690 [Pirellulaceae bacterium]|nr:hypothetical protein [Planctomycetales bacterium]MCB9937172.1 hypothetical protein [Planctomycetaceae bacterium]HRX81107.1 hypothetical protein [Pirellulaceae bacterium]